MSRRYIKPSANSSGMQIIVGIVGLIFGGYGFSRGPMTKEVAVFAFIWTLICVGSMVVGLINLTSAKGIPTEEIVSEDEGNAPEKPDVETRLRRLNRLHEDGLISDEEFDRKRAEILEEKW